VTKVRDQSQRLELRRCGFHAVDIELAPRDIPEQTASPFPDTEADQFETAVSKIGRYEDTKGFKRAALTGASHEKRVDAAEMQELFAAHLRQANVLHGKVQPQ
jgi:hypothetical protein